MANWYFGNNAGLDFNTGIAFPQNDSGISTIEACGIISDTNGNLLFYSDGETVYDRFHGIMENGEDILGHKSSTNGGLVVPFPNDPARFYLFTPDAVQHYQITNGASGEGLNYSVINLNANGGLGTVEQKNINLLANGSEKLTAVARNDGLGFWILTHYQDTFYAYSITGAGIGPAITTTIGPFINDYNNYRGSLKFSPNGSKVAIAHSQFEPTFGGDFFLYDFDNTTGIVSNGITLGTGKVYYGVEFSGNSEKLYASLKLVTGGGLGTGDIQIEQFNLLSPDIVNSRFLVDQFPGSPLRDLPGALQLGINTKIYYANPGNLNSVINKPNRLGNLSNFQFKAQSLGSGFSSFGLPSGIQSFYDNIIEFDNLCLGDETMFSLNTDRTIVNVLWDFGEPLSGGNNTATTVNASHTYSGAGIFTVTATVTFDDGETAVYQVILRILVSISGLEITITECDLDGVDDGIAIFDLNEAIPFLYDIDEIEDLPVLASYFETIVDAQNFENPIENDTAYENLFSGQIVYARIFQSLDCIGIAEVTLDAVVPNPLVDIAVDVCAAQVGETSVTISIINLATILLNDYPDSTFLFYRNLEDATTDTGQLSSSAAFADDEERCLYYRLESNGGCLGIGKIFVNVTDPLDLEDVTVFLCSSGEGVVLSPPGSFATYVWNTEQETPSITVFEDGDSEVTVTTNSGCQGFVRYTVLNGATFDVSLTVNDFQQYNSIVVNNEGSDGASLLYSIDGGLSFQTSPVFDNLTPGIYNVVVMGSDSCNAIDQLVIVRGAPRYFTPNGDSIHDIWHEKNAVNYDGMVVKIFDRYGKQLHEMNNRSRGWDGTYAGRLMPTNAYWYRIEYEGAEYYGHFTLVRRR
jgi:gliding motility-associated-like protein